mmetsp:Transcript_17827/g.39890  ORF Transcript_17827/g.39890 Transcript_17827/m.39890 type:complete len:236 (-) Transcript_17827:663-1370(-)
MAKTLSTAGRVTAHLLPRSLSGRHSYSSASSWAAHSSRVALSRAGRRSWATCSSRRLWSCATTTPSYASWTWACISASPSGLESSGAASGGYACPRPTSSRSIIARVNAASKALAAISAPKCSSRRRSQSGGKTSSPLSRSRATGSNSPTQRSRFGTALCLPLAFASASSAAALASSRRSPRRRQGPSSGMLRKAPSAGLLWDGPARPRTMRARRLYLVRSRMPGPASWLRWTTN